MRDNTFGSRISMVGVEGEQGKGIGRISHAIVGGYSR